MMMRLSHAIPHHRTGQPAEGSNAGDRRDRVIVACAAAALIVAAFFLPIWRAALQAPQYPMGLDLIVTGSGVSGDVREINGLNHYIGMRPFEDDAVPEMALWRPSLALALLGMPIAVFARRRWLRVGARLGLWGFPIGVLADIQYRLWQFGHELDPHAPLRVDPFTPRAVGPTKVWNFTAFTRPDAAMLALFGAALIVTVGPSVLRRIRRARARTSTAIVGALLLSGAVLVVSATPVAAQEHHEQHDTPTPSGPAVREPGQHVDGDLQERVRAAARGATLRVAAGEYVGSLVIDRPLTLLGEGRPHLIGPASGSVIQVNAPDVTIRGFVVSGGGPGPVGNPAGISVGADRVSIEDVDIFDTYLGIAAFSSSQLRIVDVTIRGRGGPISGEDHAVAEEHDATHPAHKGSRGDGIYLVDVRDALIRQATLWDVRDGVYLSFGADVLIDMIDVRDSRYGVHAMFTRRYSVVESTFARDRSGIILMYGGDAFLLRNTMRDIRSPSTGFGLLLKDVQTVEAIENHFLGDRIGIQIDGPAGSDPASTSLHANHVAQNDIGVALLPSAHATFRWNAFVDNLVQVAPLGAGVAGKSVWSSEGAGNYWSTYRGFDRRGDGLGDLPHVEGGSSALATVREPMLGGISSSPGYRLLSLIEARWAHADPVLIDELPLMKPPSMLMASHGDHAATPGSAHAATPARPAAARALGSLLAAVSILLLLRTRRARRLTPGEVMYAA